MRRKNRMEIAAATVHGEKGYSHFRDEPTEDRRDTIDDELDVLLTATAAQNKATRAFEEVVRDSRWWDEWTANLSMSSTSCPLGTSFQEDEISDAARPSGTDADLFCASPSPVASGGQQIQSAESPPGEIEKHLADS